MQLKTELKMQWKRGEKKPVQHTCNFRAPRENFIRIPFIALKFMNKYLCSRKPSWFGEILWMLGYYDPKISGAEIKS